MGEGAADGASEGLQGSVELCESKMEMGTDESAVKIDASGRHGRTGFRSLDSCIELGRTGGGGGHCERTGEDREESGKNSSTRGMREEVYQSRTELEVESLQRRANVMQRSFP